MIAALLLLAQLPGTSPMTPMADPAMEMLDGIHTWLDARTASAPARRAQRPGDRQTLRQLIGAVDPPVPFESFALHSGQVHWPVAPGMEARGVWNKPARPRCYQAVLGGSQADPECASVTTGAIDRASTLAANARLKKTTNQTHREFLYRMAFQVGRHPIGYEVEKLLSLVDWFARQPAKLPIHVTGVGDGALAALFACALDERISQCKTVNLEFNDRELAQNPLFQNIWRFSEHFDKARLAALIHPRKLEESKASAPALDAPTEEVAAWIEYTQSLVRQAEWKRNAWFKSLPQEEARRRFHEDMVGKFPDPLDPWQGQVATRPRYDDPAFAGFEVKIPVRGTIFAYGHLLVPKDLKPGERRPLVVAQHGLSGRPEDTILKEPQRIVYDEFAAKLARLGYIVYAPQNLYIHEERFRTIHRKASPLGLTLFSFIAAQHKQHLNWLETLPFVDPAKIGFYGLSYGGRTALYVPPIEPRYKVVICSGNFNEWLWKTTTIEEPFTYMFTREYEIVEWNLGHTFGHFELAALIAPRPFMVERGHTDGVGIDEWVSYEYAKVRRHYMELGIPAKTEIEYFNGPHRIWGKGAFDFLRKHLGNPR